jgi:hypothetical protein
MTVAKIVSRASVGLLSRCNTMVVSMTTSTVTAARVKISVP